jgi:hypothetical protein
VGRRHLISFVAVAAALALAATATATGAIYWHTVGDGTATGPTLTAAKGYIATSRSSAVAQFGSRLTAAARAKLGKVDFTNEVLVAVFGEYGCNDKNVVTTALVQHGKTLTVDLVPQPPAPGTVTCQALFPTYRFVAVPRSNLESPLPTRVVVLFA